MATATTHIHLDEHGRAWIDETNTKVVEVVLETIAHGSIPEEIVDQHPHLSLAQVHAALAYYDDHRAEFDAEIQRQHREVEAMRADAAGQPSRQELLDKLRAKGITP